VAGPSGLVDAVKRKARTAAARCYADAFLPRQAPSFVDRVMQMLRTPAGEAADADILSPRPRGRLGWVFRPFAGARQAAPSGRILRPATSTSTPSRPATRPGERS